MSNELTREQLEADANLLRERLAKNLEALEFRSHEGGALASGVTAAAAVGLDAAPEFIPEPKLEEKNLPAAASSEDNPPPREQLEADANFLRERLAKNLESLDHRRHEAFDVKAQIKKHPLPLVIAGASALVAIAGGSALAAYRIRAQRHDPWRKLTTGIAALSSAVRHPEKHEAHNDSISKEIVRGVVVTMGTFVATQLAKRALYKFAPDLWQEPQTGSTR